MNYLELAWSKLDNPLALATVVQILMFFVFKPIVVRIFEASWETHNPGLEYPNPWKGRDLVLNLWPFVVSWGLAVLRLGTQEAGQTFVVGLIAGVASIGEYEGLKNILRVLGVNISKFGVKG